jgi:hypothetical protein
MKRSIATVCLSGTLDEKLVAAAHAGFDGVELFENDLIASPLAPARCARAAASSACDRPLPAVPRLRGRAPRARRNLRRAEAKFDVMEQLGAPTMLVCSNVSPTAIDDDALAAEQLRELAGARRARAADRLRGARLGPPRERVRPRWRIVRPPTTRRSASAWTRSTSSRAARPRTIARSRARSSSSSSSPTRRTWTWTCCSGAATTAAFRAGRVARR